MKIILTDKARELISKMREVSVLKFPKTVELEEYTDLTIKEIEKKIINCGAMEGSSVTIEELGNAYSLMIIKMTDVSNDIESPYYEYLIA